MERMILITALVFLFVSCGESAENKKTVPLKYLRDSGLYDAMKNKSEYIKLFMENVQQMGTSRNIQGNYDNTKMSYRGSMGVKEVERSDLVASLKHAGCDLYNQTVQIPNNEPSVIMYPSCVMLQQCGGCCGHPDVSCQPTATAKKSVQVTKYKYDGSQATPMEKVDFLEVEEHLGCQCRCKISEKDCNAKLHKFDNYECKCKCLRSRTSCPDNKRWDDNICDCRCSAIHNCGTGYKYDLKTCRCEANIQRSGSSGGSSTGGNQDPANNPEKKNPCTHLKCPFRYKAIVVTGGRCICKFDYSSLRRG